MTYSYALFFKNRLPVDDEIPKYKVQGMPWLFWQKKKAAFALICKGRPLKFMGEDRSVNYKSKLKRTKFECGFQDGTFDPAKLFFTTANRDHGCDFVIIVANDHILFG